MDKDRFINRKTFLRLSTLAFAAAFVTIWYLVTGRQLICPCHGSKYEAATGKVLQGPAGLPLARIPFSTDAKTGEIIIKI